MVTAIVQIVWVVMVSMVILLMMVLWSDMTDECLVGVVLTTECGGEVDLLHGVFMGFVVGRAWSAGLHVVLTVRANHETQAIPVI